MKLRGWLLCLWLRGRWGGRLINGLGARSRGQGRGNGGTACAPAISTVALATGSRAGLARASAHSSSP
eukprot:11062241-Alexandrium_andersonii.AAC.1